MTKQLHLGAFMRPVGIHTAWWRYPGAYPDANFNLAHLVRFIQKLEQGRFDAFFMADHLALLNLDIAALRRSATATSFEPFTLLSALAMVTERIGLVATASTTFDAPYHIARRFASLDHISGGRAAWNVVTSVTDMEARNFNRDAAPATDLRYDRAAEFVQVVRGLWDSWEDDAFVRDKASGINYDPAKLHPLNHSGPHFKVAGPLNVQRTPQGAPVIVQAGASDQGRELAAATADVVYAAAQTLEAAQAYYASVKGRMAKYGRHPDELKIMPGIMAIPGKTRQEAQDRYDILQEAVDPLVGLGALANYLGDLSAYPLDGPVPEPPKRRMHSRAGIFLDIARRNNFTIRQLYLSIAGGNGHRTVIGTPADIVDAMEEWFHNEAADGFNILPPWLPGGLDDVVDMVVPEMQRRGLYRTAYEGPTLRENLGIPYAAFGKLAQRPAAE